MFDPLSWPGQPTPSTPPVFMGNLVRVDRLNFRLTKNVPSIEYESDLRSNEYYLSSSENKA